MGEAVTGAGAAAATGAQTRAGSGTTAGTEAEAEADAGAADVVDPGAWRAFCLECKRWCLLGIPAHKTSIGSR